MLRIVLISSFLISALLIKAQEDDPVIPPPDTLVNVDRDSIQVETEKIGLIAKFKNKTYPNPVRAAGLSLILPGSGQAYNKKIWKIPIIYAGLGSMGYFIIDNTKNYRLYRDAYLDKVDDDINTIDPFPNASENTILSIRNRYDKRRQQSYVGFVAVWVLNSVDAFVDSHLHSFDVNEDLSLNISPSIQYNVDSLDPVLSLSLQQKSKTVSYKKFY